MPRCHNRISILFVYCSLPAGFLNRYFHSIHEHCITLKCCMGAACRGVFYHGRSQLLVVLARANKNTGFPLQLSKAAATVTGGMARRHGRYIYVIMLPAEDCPQLVRSAAVRQSTYMNLPHFLLFATGGNTSSDCSLGWP